MKFNSIENIPHISSREEIIEMIKLPKSDQRELGVKYGLENEEIRKKWNVHIDRVIAAFEKESEKSGEKNLERARIKADLEKAKLYFDAGYVDEAMRLVDGDEGIIFTAQNCGCEDLENDARALLWKWSETV